MAKRTQADRQTKTLLKLIEKYYADLAELARQRVMFEMGTRHAFHRLMADAGKPHKWTLIAEQEKKVGGRTIRPDGMFKDEMNLGGGRKQGCVLFGQKEVKSGDETFQRGNQCQV